MEQRPGMFGIQEVNDILNFICGYQSALMEHNIIDNDELDFRDFQKYVIEYYRNNASHPNWAMLIAFYVGNKNATITKFFELLTNYKSKNPKNTSR